MAWQNGLIDYLETLHLCSLWVNTYKEMFAIFDFENCWSVIDKIMTYMLSPRVALYLQAVHWRSRDFSLGSLMNCNKCIMT